VRGHCRRGRSRTSIDRDPPGYEIDTQETVDTGPTLPPGSTSPTATSQNCQQLARAVRLPSAGLTGGVFEILYDARHGAGLHPERRPLKFKRALPA
jgi:hypothetical protein